MVGRRYYCYHCDVSFPYSREARKRHAGGLVHSKIAEQHYMQYHTCTQRYEQARNKEPCRQFLSGRGCKYADQCIYSHASQQELEDLRLQGQDQRRVCFRHTSGKISDDFFAV